MGAAVDIEVFRPLVVRYCRARIGRGEGAFAVADGLAAEVWAVVLDGYRRRREGLPAFVFGVAAREVARVGAVRGVGGPAERVAALIEVLPEQQREVLVLRVVVGLSAEETAEAVGISPGAVRLVQHRALGELRRVVGAGRLSVDR